MADSARHRGWKYDHPNTRLEAHVDGIEGLRLTSSVDGVDFRFLGDTPATYYLDWDASTYTLNLRGIFNVGVDDTGYDVKFFGATTGAYMEWDESADRLNVVTTSSRALSGEEHALDVTMGGTLSSGDSMVGGNFAVTTSGTAGTWVSGIYAKVTQGATKNVNGYISGAEFEVVNSADSVSDWFVLVLNASNSGSQQGSHSSYVALRDYGSTDIQSLLWVSTDHTIGTKSDTALMTTFADGAHISHAIRFIAGATPYWILCSSQAPSGT